MLEPRDLVDAAIRLYNQEYTSDKRYKIEADFTMSFGREYYKIILYQGNHVVWKQTFPSREDNADIVKDRAYAHLLYVLLTVAKFTPYPL